MAMAAKADFPNDTMAGSPLACVIGRFARAGAGVETGAHSAMPGPMSLIAREINETVLPRRIQVLDGARVVARILVSNRRLYAVETEAGANPADPSDPQEAAGFFALTLQQATRDLACVQFRPQASEFDKADYSTSCAARALAMAAGVPLGDRSTLTGLAPFRDALVPVATAWLLADASGDRDESGGDAGLVSGLQAVRREMETAKKSRFSTRNVSCTVLPVAHGRAIALASAGGHHLLALIPRDATQAVISAWQRQF